MVATVTVRLAVAGRLALDDPVAEHVPEVRGRGWAERATLRDLMANRSGLPLRSDLEFGFDDRPEAADDSLALLAADVGGHPAAGGFWSYSNAGWCLLGRAIETAVGTTFEEAVREHLLGPAGMDATTFAVGSRSIVRASGHEVMNGRAVAVDPLVSRAYGPAGTTLVSTVPDLLRFARLHLEDPSLASMREVHADVSIAGWFDRWCLGWARFDWEGDAVWGWDGLLEGERSVLRLIPEQRAAVVLVTNGSTGRATYRSLFAELMPSSFGIEVPPVRLEAEPAAAGELSRYAGVYAWPDRRVEVTPTAQTLSIASARDLVEAFPIDARTFLVDAADPDNPTVTFGAFDADGRPGVLYVMLWGLPRVRGLGSIRRWRQPAPP
jgi:CubicO group peptidase (beta-lactamase class C family)